MIDWCQSGSCQSVASIMGAIFVICVLAFRRGIVGESLALYRRMIGQKA